MEVRLDRVGVRELIVDAVENVFLVAVVVGGDEFWRVQKPAGLKSIRSKEVAPFRPLPQPTIEAKRAR